MPRPPRIQFEGALYHVTTRGVLREVIAYDSNDRSRWMYYLKQAVRRFRLELHAFALMSNHYHLFLSTPKANLGKAMQYLNGAYAMYFNTRHKRTGHLFERRYHAVLVEDEGHYLEVSRYVHLNPVRAGIVKRPEDYIWSSYPGYHRGRKTLPWLNYGRVFDEFGEKKMAYRRYREFVADGIGKKISPPWADALGGWLLGSRRFAAKIYSMLSKEHSDSRWDSRAALDDYPLDATLDQIASAVCAYYDVGLDELRTGLQRVRNARKTFAFIARERAGASLKAISGYLGLAGIGSVSQVVKRARERLGGGGGGKLRKSISRIESHLKSEP